MTVTQIVWMPVIDQEHPPIGYDLRYVIKFSFLPRCHTNEQNVPPARKSGPKGIATICAEVCSDNSRTLRVTDQTPSQASRNLREETIPKSIARVLDASKIRSEWKQSLGKRKQRSGERDAETNSRPKSRKKTKTKGSDAGAVSEDTKPLPMRIQPGESLTHFNKLSIRDSFEPSF